MDINRLFISLISATILLVGIQVQPSYAQQSKEIILGGFNHEPAVRTSGTGLATITFEGDTLRISGDFSNLSSAFRGAYVMIGKKGESGNMLLRLKAELDDSRTGGTINAESNTFELNDVQKPLLKAGELYINITSSNHSRGELRGQIPPMK